jgi:hypothetical protein
MNTKRFLLILFIILAQTLAACAPAASTPEPASILLGYYDALEARDIDKVMSFWADDAVYSDGSVRQSGQEEIRAGQQSAINDRVTVEVSNINDTNGRLVYDYKVLVDGRLWLSGTGLTIVQDGKIIFDGTEATWTEECNRDSSQSFCATQ